jgi:hypothetical protein
VGGARQARGAAQHQAAARNQTTHTSELRVYRWGTPPLTDGRAAWVHEGMHLHDHAGDGGAAQNTARPQRHAKAKAHPPAGRSVKRISPKSHSQARHPRSRTQGCLRGQRTLRPPVSLSLHRGHTGAHERPGARSQQPMARSTHTPPSRTSTRRVRQQQKVTKGGRDRGQGCIWRRPPLQLSAASAPRQMRGGQGMGLGLMRIQNRQQRQQSGEVLCLEVGVIQSPSPETSGGLTDWCSTATTTGGGAAVRGRGRPREGPAPP